MLLLKWILDCKSKKKVNSVLEFFACIVPCTSQIRAALCVTSRSCQVVLVLCCGSQHSSSGGAGSYSVWLACGGVGGYFVFLEDKPQLCSEEQLECNVYNQKQEILLGKFEWWDGHQSLTWSLSACSSLIWFWITVFFCWCMLQSRVSCCTCRLRHSFWSKSWTQSHTHHTKVLFLKTLLNMYRVCWASECTAKPHMNIVLSQGI